MSNLLNAEGLLMVEKRKILGKLNCYREITIMITGDKGVVGVIPSS